MRTLSVIQVECIERANTEARLGRVFSIRFGLRQVALLVTCLIAVTNAWHEQPQEGGLSSWGI